ncbi:hypothetical protein ALC56_02614 [Trachymyrmex septentrionalis]|uniref:H15 domain-containing protein n=1 Tax=Trachymyrmex septentrionalis TaxID=34720 RepID=A0A195FRA0_9HYME|nr:PREDICTED: uncharacterized protein LOC108745460 [Trachymyrmex septentrionalis]KYN42812.1 hypothetical protein ALC56_02614 [Trachymyrmex septentrionalis]
MANKETKTGRKSKRVKPIKIAALVVSAIQDLRETKGSTPKKITGYISYASSIPEQRVKRQVKAALKRGVEYGILRRYRGHYFLPTGDELDRANRIAIRFAKLSTPAPTTFAKSKIKSSRKMKNSKRPQRIGNKTRKSEKVEKTRSPTVSASSSLTNEIASDIASPRTE